MESATLAVFPPVGVPRVPRWEALSCRLWFGNILVKEFVRGAPAQERLLAAFEAAGWSEFVPNPFVGNAATPAEDCLENAVKGLNRMQGKVILKFGLARNRKGAWWRVVEVE